MNLIKKWNLSESDKWERAEALCAIAGQFFVGLWAFLMLTVFPLYMKNYFSKLGVHKFRFFMAVTLCCMIPAAVCLAGKAVVRWVRSRKAGTAKADSMEGREYRDSDCGLDAASVLEKLSPLDFAMLWYLAAALLSWKFSINREHAWIGTEGWYGGLRTQLLLVLIYFLVSRAFLWKKIIFAGHFVVSGLVFLLGIGHRFGIDPLGMYEGIDASYQLRFLSTIGQATWYSSYVCTVLVIGVVLFFLEKKPALRLMLGIYCSLGFATVVTQNSDSAFIAMAFMSLGLFLAGCDSPEKMERFFEVMILMFGTFKVVGIFQTMFPKRAMELGSVSEFLSKSMVSWLILLAFCILYIAIQAYRLRPPQKQAFTCARLWRRLTVGCVAVLLGFYILFLWANTTGLLERLWGIRPDHDYLLFDDSWGNSRGFIWAFVQRTFGAFSWMRKLVGVGPDCFSVYCYADSETAGYLNRFFGQNQTLTNAHNEFVNTLFCMGIFGLISYLAVFFLAFRRFFIKRKECPLALMGALVVMAYGAHNFFCYQQVCCAPFLFFILGMAENAVRTSKSDFSE